VHGQTILGALALQFLTPKEVQLAKSRLGLEDGVAPKGLSGSDVGRNVGVGGIRPVAETELGSDGTTPKYGFWLHVYAEGPAIIFQVKEIQK
jgi:hypothetical protein